MLFINQQVFLETLRLYPPISGLNKVSLDNGTTLSGYPIPAGTLISVGGLNSLYLTCIAKRIVHAILIILYSTVYMDSVYSIPVQVAVGVVCVCITPTSLSLDNIITEFECCQFSTPILCLLLVIIAKYLYNYSHWQQYNSSESLIITHAYVYVHACRWHHQSCVE